MVLLAAMCITTAVRAEEPEETCGFTAESPRAGAIYHRSKPSSASHWGETNQGSPVELTGKLGDGGQTATLR